MAENAHERTERPTPKRREEARRKGQLPRSPELNAASVVLIAGASLYFLGSHVGSGLHGMMRATLSLSHAQATDETYAVSMFAGALSEALAACAPLFGLTLIAALGAPLALGGWNLSVGVLTPDITRLSPLAGLRRIFSVRGIVELLKAFAKFLLLAIVAAVFLWMKSSELLGLGSEPTYVAVAHAASLSGQALLAMAAALGLIAAVDVPWQIHQHNKQLRMTRQEVREELKESEGSPEVKGRIRQAQQELASRRMMQEVPKADVVITNPTHYAVALRYDERRMRAPIVVAKGADAIAARIREVATEHLVPIFEAPPLARALYRNVDIGAEIPASLYVAVAQVLTYVYQVRNARRYGATPPPPPAIDPSVDPTTRH